VEEKMADTAKIQQRLNTDAEYRKKFLRDPAGTLREEGVVVTPDKEKSLNNFVQQASSAAGTPSDHKVNINGGIAIGVRF
jgi:hypothetical protein